MSTVAGLTSALANTVVGHMVLAPGTYFLSGELSVLRSVVIEAAVAGSVVLHAQASSSSSRRVLIVNPGSSGVVQLIGLNITGGYQVRTQSSHRPNGNALLTCNSTLAVPLVQCIKSCSTRNGYVPALPANPHRPHGRLTFASLFAGWRC